MNLKDWPFVRSIPSWDKGSDLRFSTLQKYIQLLIEEVDLLNKKLTTYESKGESHVHQATDSNSGQR